MSFCKTALSLSCWKQTLGLGIKKASICLSACISVLEQNLFEFKLPHPRKRWWRLRVDQNLSSPAFCFEDLFSCCFKMKNSLLGIAFPTRVSVRRKVQLPPRHAARTSPTPAPRMAPWAPSCGPRRPQGVKQTEKKIRKKEKENKQAKKNPKQVTMAITTKQSRTS